jgi:uncharacterized protein (TIGR03000 family)
VAGTHRPNVVVVHRNFFRPYYASFGLFGYGGLGYGYGGYGYGYGDYGGYPSYGSDYSYSSPAYPAPGYGMPGPGGDLEMPPPDNAVHLQFFVPENAEVYFDGVKTTQTGKVREFTSPALSPGNRYTYRISVRYTGPDGKQVNDTRDIFVRPNDWFSIDFNRPAPSDQPPDMPPAMPPADKAPAGA